MSTLFVTLRLHPLGFQIVWTPPNLCLTYIPDAHRKGKLNKKAEKLCFDGYSLKQKNTICLMKKLQRLLYVGMSPLTNLFQHDSTTVEVNEGVNGCEKDDDISVVPKEEEEPVEQLEQQQQYPRRQRTMPVRYGVDEYVDTAF